MELSVKKLLPVAALIVAVAGLYSLQGPDPTAEGDPELLNLDAGRNPEDHSRKLETQSALRSNHPHSGPTSEQQHLVQSLSPTEAYEAAMGLAECSAMVETSTQPNQAMGMQTASQQTARAVAFCNDLAQDSSIYDLAKHAAESGVVEAQLDFPAIAALAFKDEEKALDAKLIEDYKRSSIRYLQSAARAGKIEALQRLSEAYRVGRFSQSDPKLAYAYALAYAQRSGSAMAHERALELSAFLSATDAAMAQQVADSM